MSGRVLGTPEEAARIVVECLRGTPAKDAARLLSLIEKDSGRPASPELREAFATHFEGVAAALRAMGGGSC